MNLMDYESSNMLDALNALNHNFCEFINLIYEQKIGCVIMRVDKDKTT